MNARTPSKVPKSVIFGQLFVFVLPFAAFNDPKWIGFAFAGGRLALSHACDLRQCLLRRLYLDFGLSAAAASGKPAGRKLIEQKQDKEQNDGNDKAFQRIKATCCQTRYETENR